jgi:hypothetical protein
MRCNLIVVFSVLTFSRLESVQWLMTSRERSNSETALPADDGLQCKYNWLSSACRDTQPSCHVDQFRRVQDKQ